MRIPRARLDYYESSRARRGRQEEVFRFSKRREPRSRDAAEIWGDMGRYGEMRGDIPLLGRCSWPVHTSARYLRSNAFEGSSSILR